MRRLWPEPTGGGATAALGSPRNRLSSAPHLARFPLADDGARPGAVRRAGGADPSAAAVAAVPVESDRHLDHARAGDRSSLLGRPLALDGAICRGRRPAPRGPEPDPPGGRPRAHSEHARQAAVRAAGWRPRARLAPPPTRANRRPHVLDDDARSVVARGDGDRLAGPVRGRVSTTRPAADLSF